MCSGRVEPAFVMKALALGADGVMIAGCHPGECHYIEQNTRPALRDAHAPLRRLGLKKARPPDLGFGAEGRQLAAPSIRWSRRPKLAPSSGATTGTKAGTSPWMIVHGMSDVEVAP
jgi:hypothetical protein